MFILIFSIQGRVCTGTMREKGWVMNNANPVAAALDYDRMAAHFDRFLPLVEPVGLAVLEHLPTLPEGACVLDVACGTGEPGLTLARRAPGVRLLGVDAAVGMIETVRAKAARENLANVRFEVMMAESLAGCADGSMDAVLSRFGLLMFGDVAASARELARVLRPGAHFSVAVWADMAKNTLVHAVVAALRPRVPAELLQVFDRMGDWATEGRRERLLREVGLTDVRSEWFRWHYEFPNQEEWWQLVSGPGMLARVFAEMTTADQEQVRSQTATALAAYRQVDGSYRIPHACQLWWGSR